MASVSDSGSDSEIELISSSNSVTRTSERERAAARNYRRSSELDSSSLFSPISSNEDSLRPSSEFVNITTRPSSLRVVSSSSCSSSRALPRREVRLVEEEQVDDLFEEDQEEKNHDGNDGNEDDDLLGRESFRFSCSPYSSSAADLGYKIIMDPIHGHIRFDDSIIQLIDTSQFQRLRGLKQLGSTYFVFPGASHNRFEHSLGVCHLAGEWIDHLSNTNPREKIRPHEKFLVRSAGLLHDLGHGPFSHVWDNEVIPRVCPNLGWTHEDGSFMMIDHLIDENYIELFESSDIKMIKDMIHSDRDPDGPPREREFLYQIVANTGNSVDVDKFDYLARDCHNLGLRSSYDSTRLLQFSRIVGGNICFHAKEVYNLYEMFHTRYSLHKQVYSHRVGKAIEYMISDAFVAANPVMDFVSALQDPSRYIQLNDGILTQIEFSTDPDLRESRQIIERIRKRELYRFVDEFIVPKEICERFNKVSEADIAAFQSKKDGVELRPEDLIVQNLKINYALKDKNPVDNCLFYSSSKDQASFTIPKRCVSSLIPDQFQEKYVRLYCKDPSKVEAAQRAFSNYVREHPVEGGDSSLSLAHYSLSQTPIKSPSQKKRKTQNSSSFSRVLFD